MAFIKEPKPKTPTKKLPPKDFPPYDGPGGPIPSRNKNPRPPRDFPPYDDGRVPVPISEILDYNNPYEHDWDYWKYRKGKVPLGGPDPMRYFGPAIRDYNNPYEHDWDYWKYKKGQVRLGGPDPMPYGGPGEPIPTRNQTTNSPYGPSTGFPGPRANPEPIYSIPSGEIFNSQNEAMRKAMYNDLMAQQLAGAQANIPVQVPVQVPAQTQQQVPMIPKSSNNQAMQNYSNLLQQGVQNYASQMGNPNFGVNQPAQQKQQKNISTQGYPTPRFL